MAETKTKAELEKENEELREKLSAPQYSVEENYQKEFERLTKKAEKAESERDAMATTMRDEAAAREVTRNDEIAAEERRLAQFGIREIRQNEHTRFRLLPKAPGGQRDIFGDPTTEVFDLGVDLQYYNGGIYVPLSVVVECAQSVEMLTKEQADLLIAENAQMKSQVESAGSIAQELISGITSRVDDFYSHLSNVGGVELPAVSESIEEKPGDGIDAGQASDPDLGSESDGISSGADDPESKPDESGTGSFFAKLAD